MNKLYKIILILACITFTSNLNYAKVKVNKLYYNILSEDDRTVEVTHYYYDAEYKNENYVSGSLEIPAKIIYNSKTYSVTSIGNSAFCWCKGLTSVTIPNSVTAIGSSAFCYCESLSSVIIPNSVTAIGSSAFCYCESLSSVTIPNSVTSIGYNAFGSCSGLTSVTIPNSVTSIGSSAFCYCESLTSVTIPNSVTSIGTEAFRGCTGNKKFIVDENNQYYSSIEGVLYNKDKTKLVFYPAGNEKTTFSIPQSVTSIGGFAFCECNALTSITIPNSVTSIGGFAFYYCRDLTSVTIPNSVTSIGDYAFYGCSGLKTINCMAQTPPAGYVSSFGNSTLMKCTLYVPIGCKSAYEKVDPWRNFWNIEETDFGGVNDITVSDNTIKVINGEICIEGDTEGVKFVEVYNIKGECVYSGTDTKISNLAKGVYLVRIGSTTTKVII